MDTKKFDDAYSIEAVQIGHKIYMISMLEKEIADHIAKSNDLNREKAAFLGKETETKKPRKNAS